MNIASYGYYDKSNLGDDLIMMALRRIIKLSADACNADVCVSFVHSSLKSSDEFQGLVDFFTGKPPDVLMLGSGGLFPKNRIRNFSKFLLLGAKCKNKALLGIGVDPINRYRSWYRRIFESARCVTTRDNGSAKNILALNLKDDRIINVSADLVIAAKDLLFPNNNSLEMVSGGKLEREGGGYLYDMSESRFRCTSRCLV